MIILKNISDAEMLLLTQSFTRIFSSKKTPLINIMTFLISKGVMSTPDMTKSDMCIAFKTLVESQPDYIKPSVQPMQMPLANNNMLAYSQNNNMMHCHPYQAPIQQVCIAIIYSTL